MQGWCYYYFCSFIAFLGQYFSKRLNLWIRMLQNILLITSNFAATTRFTLEECESISVLVICRSRLGFTHNLFGSTYEFRHYFYSPTNTEPAVPLLLSPAPAKSQPATPPLWARGMYHHRPDTGRTLYLTGGNAVRYPQCSCCLQDMSPVA